MRYKHKIISLLLCLSFSLSLSACFTPTDKPGMTTYSETTVTTTEGSSETSATTKTASGFTDIAIMSTSDMHGKCWDINVLTDNEEPHNMLKVSSAVTETREKYGVENVILIDNGDLFQGAPESQFQILQYASGESQDIPAMALCLSEIGYDAMSPGDHEFDFGWETMNKIYQWLDSQGVKVVSGNICYDGSDREHNAGDNVFEPYIIKEIKVNGNTHKIGILGLENSDITRFELPENYKGMTFVHPDNKEYSLAKEAELNINKMKQDGCEFIIVSYHGGALASQEPLKFGVNTENQAIRIIAENSDIDLMITGHDHTSEYSNSSFTGSNGKQITIVNGGGQELTRSVFRFTENEDGELSWEIRSSENIILDDYKSDEDLKKKIGPYFDIAKKAVLEPIGKASGNWDRNANFYTECTDTENIIFTSVKDTVSLRLKDKFKKASDARFDLDHLDVDLVMSSVSIADNYIITTGDISYKDIYMMYRDPDSVYVIPMTGSEIKSIMEENASERLSADIVNGNAVFEPVNDNDTNIIFGCVNFEYDLSKRDGDKVTIKSFSNGRSFKSDGVYLVAVTDNLLSNAKCGLRDYSPDDSIWSQKADTHGEVIQDIIAEYINNRTTAYGSVTPSVFNWNWNIVYSAPVTSTDNNKTIATYVKEPMDEKKYIIYNDASGYAISSDVMDTGLYPVTITSSGNYLKGPLPDKALVFTLYYDENFNFTLRDQKGNFLVSSPSGGLYLTDKPVEDRYQFWHMEKVDGGWRLSNIGGTGTSDHSLMCRNNTFNTGTYTTSDDFVFSFYEVE